MNTSDIIILITQRKCNPTIWEKGSFDLLQWKVLLTPEIIKYLDFGDWLTEYATFNDDGSIWVGEYAADNFATRGLLLEILLMTNSGVTYFENYRAILIKTLCELWD